MSFLMMWGKLSVSLIVLFSLIITPTLSRADDKDPFEKVPELIALTDHDDFDIRETATQDLSKILEANFGQLHRFLDIAEQTQFSPEQKSRFFPLVFKMLQYKALYNEGFEMGEREDHERPEYRELSAELRGAWKQGAAKALEIFDKRFEENVGGIFFQQRNWHLVKVFFERTYVYTNADGRNLIDTWIENRSADKYGYNREMTWELAAQLNSTLAERILRKAIQFEKLPELRAKLVLELALLNPLNATAIIDEFKGSQDSAIREGVAYAIWHLYSKDPNFPIEKWITWALQTPDNKGTIRNYFLTALSGENNRYLLTPDQQNSFYESALFEVQEKLARYFSDSYRKPQLPLMRKMLLSPEEKVRSAALKSLTYFHWTELQGLELKLQDDKGEPADQARETIKGLLYPQPTTPDNK